IARCSQKTNFLCRSLSSQRDGLVQQLEDKETFLDLTLTPVEPLTPGNGQTIGEKKEKLANACLSGLCVLGYRRGRFQGLFTFRPRTRQADEHDPVEALQCPSCPYTICQP